MPIYRVVAEFTVSGVTIVKADTRSHALQLAEERQAALTPFGVERHSADPTVEWVIEEADGSAAGLKIDAVDTDTDIATYRDYNEE